MVRRGFRVVEARAGWDSEQREVVREERVTRHVALGRALSDPIRVRMLGMMAEVAAMGRGCCDLPNLGALVDEEDENIGVCVCEFEDYFGMGQSKVSYHVRKLKEAGLVREEKRGKWSFYSLDEEAARRLLADVADHLCSSTKQVGDGPELTER